MESVATRTARRVSSLTLVRVFYRSLFLQASWNARGMQNLGFAHAIAPALSEIYGERELAAKAAARHLEFFNCHPYMAAAILGGAVRLEERVAAGMATPESVSAFKRALGPPLAALGDGFFWLALRPAAALTAAAMAPWLGLGCIAVFLLLYNSVHVAARIWLFSIGYARAENVIAPIAHAHFASGTPALKTCSAVLAGALAGGSVLAAGVPFRPYHALLVGCAIVAAVVLLPKVGATRAVYIALLVGLALGARFF